MTNILDELNRSATEQSSVNIEMAIRALRMTDKACTSYYPPIAALGVAKSLLAFDLIRDCLVHLENAHAQVASVPIEASEFCPHPAIVAKAEIGNAIMYLRSA